MLVITFTLKSLKKTIACTLFRLQGLFKTRIKEFLGYNKKKKPVSDPLIRSKIPYSLGHGNAHSAFTLFVSYVSSNLYALITEKVKKSNALCSFLEQN